MQTVSEKFKTQVYSGEALYYTNLQINEKNVPTEQIAKIEIDSPIIDTTSESFYLGTFISQSLNITFKNLDGLDIASNNEVYLEVGEELGESKNLLNTEAEYTNTHSSVIASSGTLNITNLGNWVRVRYANVSLSAGTYTLNTNFINSSGSTIRLYAYKLDGTTLINSTTATTSTSGTQTLTFTTDENGVCIDIYSNASANTNNANVIFNNIQLEEGTSATEYEQYHDKIEYVPIGHFLIDDLAEDYFETCEITCLDYAVKFKPNIDYSPCFTDGKANVQTIFNYICNYFGVEVETDISTLPNINVEVGTYDSSISGKQWISYLAEIMGCNVKINRDGKLILIPLNQPKATTINALESEEFTLGEKFEISRVVYFDAIRNFTYGEDKYNTLFIRQDNPFVTDTNVVENIYKSINAYIVHTEEDYEIEIDDGDSQESATLTMFGNTYQNTYSGVNLYNYKNTTNVGTGVTADEDGWISMSYDNTSGSSNVFLNYFTDNLNLISSTQYAIFLEVKSVSGSGRLYVTSKSGTVGQFENQVTAELSSLTSNTTSKYLGTTKSSYTGNTGLRTFLRFEPEQSGSITFRISVLADTTTTTSNFVYEPYVGEMPSPNPDYPQNVETISGRNEIKITGKNLFDKDNIIEGKYINASGDLVNDSNNFVGNYIQVDNTDLYYISSKTGNTKRIAYYDNKKIFISRQLISAVSGILTIPNNTKYIRISGYNDDLNTLQLEKNDYFTEYEPYQSQSYEVNLGINLFDKDNANIIDGYVNYNTGVFTLPSASNQKCFYIKIEPNTTYTWSNYISNTEVGYGLYSNIPSINDTASTYGQITQQKTITTGANDNYLIMLYSSITATINLSQFQLEEGNEATEYAPFIKGSNNIYKPSLTCGETNISKSNCTVSLDDDVFTLTATGTDMYFSQVANSGTSYTANRGELFSLNGHKFVYLYCTNNTIKNNYITWYDENKVSLGYNGSNTKNNYCFTAKDNAKYFTVRFGFSSATSGTSYKTKVMVSFSPITDYERVDAQLELCKIGNYRDYIAQSKGKNLFDKDNQQLVNINTSGTKRYGIEIEANNKKISFSGTLWNGNLAYKLITNETYGDYAYIYQNTTINVPEKIVIYCGTENMLLTQVVDNLQIEFSNQPTEYEPYGVGVWYKHKEISKIIFDGIESWTFTYSASNGMQAVTSLATKGVSGYGICNVAGYSGTQSDNFFYIQSSGVNAVFRKIYTNGSQISTVANWNSFVSSNYIEVYYVLSTPTTEIITDETLINNLNNNLKITLLNGINNITTTNNLQSYLKLDYITKEYFKIWSLYTKNYGDISLDAWDIIGYTLGEDENENIIEYQTYNNNHIVYEMNISSEVDTQIPTKQREITTNIYDNDEEVKIKMIKTLLDYINGQVTIQAEETNPDLYGKLTQLRLDVEAIQNIFQITGGNNLIKNSQFLFDDPEDSETHLRTYWNFTNNGTNPYQNIGHGYDGDLAGQTTAVAKIQLRDIIAQTSVANITGLKVGQIYTLNYSYKQNTLTTTQFTLYDDNNNIIKYYVVNDETGESEEFDLDITYNEEKTQLTSQVFQFIAQSSDCILKIETTTTSGDTNSGYFYLYDLMLNSGDKKPWEPASSEVYSTVLKMSQLGMQVYATGSNIATLINADGFRIYRYQNGQLSADPITYFDDSGLNTGDAKTTSVYTGKYKLTEITINNVEHHVEYFEESD